MRAVCIIRGIALFSCCFNVRPAFSVMLGKPVCCGLRRCCLQIKQLALILLLIIGEPVSHMLQNFFCKLLGTLICHITAQPSCIQPRLVHSHKTDRGKVIVKASQIPLCVRIKSLI